MSIAPRVRTFYGAGGAAEPGVGDAFLARLRAETRPLHESSERRIGAAGLVDRHGYARLLRTLFPLYASVEAQCALFSQWSTLDPPLALEERRRADLLIADLASLAVEPGFEGAEDVGLPELALFEQAFGALYVVEGSRLGGAMLARQISAALGAQVEGAFRFLRSSGGDVARLWPELRAALCCYAGDCAPHDADAVIEGALDTFCCFDRRLEIWAA